jgi:hypothetical protein
MMSVNSNANAMKEGNSQVTLSKSLFFTRLHFLTLVLSSAYRRSLPYIYQVQCDPLRLSQRSSVYGCDIRKKIHSRRYHRF